MRILLLAAALTAITLPGAGVAQEEAHMDHACPAQAAPLPAALASFAARVPLSAAKTADKLGKATLTFGQAVDGALVSAPEVKYPLRPEKPGGSVSYGGLFGFTVAEAGTYRVALGSGAWIDVLKDGRAIGSSAHGHGPDCSGVRKMVDFPLEPGSYTLQIAANGQPSLPLLVTRLP
ncbi:MAG: homogentisate 1,2-dioxygenase [Candidatus Andeanibacterium colombiense]|uniref:Homogentisate 1,2-dioxygenase n=1 Tax=Candidatus Andeanibacterium colombiense TaxID=3121345 RepID=A0AAJ6BQQ9_9SPHN|nr:MAG: homogentisate 1,2-dioxygenase [Sphingomonadaceae bacterium]